MKCWMVIACAGLLVGCAEERFYERERGGYGVSLTMGGGSGVRGVYPDAALYAHEFGFTNEYAGALIADMRTTPPPVGAPGAETREIAGAGLSSSVASQVQAAQIDAPVTELIVPDYHNPDAPIIELIVPGEVVVETDSTGATEPVVLPTLPPDSPTNQVPPDPPSIPAPEPEAEPPPSPQGAGKPL